ncbi:MAG: CHAT domain-containing protein, partial [Hyphomonadaceae bacterium]|nr:CHAT domain-containing protein [Hyphomonadaceae bacterium]
MHLIAASAVALSGKIKRLKAVSRLTTHVVLSLASAVAWSSVAFAQVLEPANKPDDPVYNNFSYPAQVRDPTPVEAKQLIDLFLAAGGTGMPVSDDVALSNWHKVIDLSLRTWGPNHPTTANLYFRLASRLGSMGQNAQVASLYRQALAIQVKTLGRYHNHTIWTISALAASLSAPEAEPLWLELLSVSDARLQAARGATANCLELLADSIAAQGRGAEAGVLRGRARALRGDKVDDSALTGPPIAGMEMAADNALSTIAYNPAFVRPATPAEVAQRKALATKAERLRAGGDLPGAALAWREALTLDENTWGPMHPGVGAALIGLAATAEAQGAVADAGAYLKRAVDAYQRALGAEHFETLAASSLLAKNLTAQKKFSEAEAVLRDVLKTRQAVMRQRVRNYADDLERYADGLERVFRYPEAEASLRRALSIYEALKGKDEGMTSHLLVKLARNLSNQGHPAEAEPYYEQAAQTYHARIMADPADDAWLANAMALNKLKLSKIEGVENTLKQSLAVYRASQSANRLRTANGLSDLGYFYLETSKPEMARPLLEEALAIRSERLGAFNSATASTAQNLAFANLAMNRPAAALDAARKALASRAALQGAAGVSAPEPAQRNGRTQYAAAAMMLTRADWIVAKLRPTEAAALRAEAFEAVQRVASSSAADAMTRSAARRLADSVGAGEAEIQWRASLDRIDWLNSEIATAATLGTSGDTKRTRLLDELASQIKLRKEAESRLAAKSPAYFDMLKSEPVTIDDLQATSGVNARLLGDDEALILLNPGAAWLPEGQRRGLVFVVTKQKVAWAEIPLSPEELGSEVRTLHNQLASGGQTTKPHDNTVVIGYERQRAFNLYTKLFGAPQVAEALAGKSRWLLSPQGSLVSLPFAALVMTAPEGGEEFDADPAYMRRTNWLGLKKTLALVPSVPMLRVQRLAAPATGGGETFFGLGDPAFRGVPDPPLTPEEVADKDEQRRTPNDGSRYFSGTVGDPARIAELKRLPATNGEILSLAAFFKADDSDVALQMNATEAELRRRNRDKSLLRADIIVFATHGLIAGGLDETLTEPALALTPPRLAAGQTPVAENDGLLTASEAASLRLSARWVILSACNTAAGDNNDAESLAGLARAFFMAGAHSLLASHYPVLDSSAEKLTT